MAGGMTPFRTTAAGPGQRLQYGVATVTISDAVTGSTAVTFDTPFIAAPIVVTSWQGNNTAWTTGAASVTESGFSVVLTQRAGNAASASVSVGWIAIGM